MILLVYAHPYPRRSRACAALLSALQDVPGLQTRSLYEMYPDFDIDGAAEREALVRADAVVWMHPLYWYTVPALMKHWFEQVLVSGFAFGEDGSRLAGKDCLWVATTGGDEDAFSADGRHRHGFAAFAPVVEQTARYCGMNWREPFLLHGAHRVSSRELVDAGGRLRERIASLPAVGAAA